MKNYDLVVSIVTYNSSFKYLERIVEDIKNISDLNILTVMIDNVSNSKNYNEILKLKTNVISSGTNLGYGKANNLVNKISKQSKYFLVLNPDIEINKNTIKELYNFLEKNKDYGLISPLLKSKDEKYYNIFRKNFNFLHLLLRRIRKIDDRTEKKTFFELLKKFNEIVDVKYVSGSFMFFRRDVFQKIGGFNDKFFMYFEDIEICDVIINNNFKIGILKTSEAIHLRNRESYKKLIPLIYHFYSWIIYKLFNRVK